MIQNRVVVERLLQVGAIDVLQPDVSCGGVNEIVAILLLAHKFGVPTVLQSGGAGLPEYTQHLGAIDYVVISGKKSILEHVDHSTSISFTRPVLIPVITSVCRLRDTV